ncbi:uncharacterized protein LOC122037921 isoform X3 [Zingiber officinale]|uniref:uncharacterized protein LOC122037921 isoform X3 n=1 Tax=Zingiber officinale TaxID=94328 RepID=UPI001C4CBBC8|nr:uncharacterized protein LOC122037921 isoform X3 [Zingiber officinale]XP_042453338.1 uncharacterized protein LOC122037921 isoform X3 [Zingiber officinale]XP_042453339.1 uncharacterized protein LOC122037921 isoform X3 [Zingiber officinale]
MAFGTVSFEELLGHCNEVFKNNQRCTVDLEKRMQSLGYVTKVELEDEEILDDSKFTSPVSGFQRPFFEFVSVSVVQLSKKGPEEYILSYNKISETTLPGYPKLALHATDSYTMKKFQLPEMLPKQ